MLNFIHEVIRDPREYLPFLIMLGCLIVFWAGLCLAGLIAVRAEGRRLKVACALVALAFGTIGVLAHIPISMESQGWRCSFDFRWMFLVPVGLGIAGMVLWRRGARGLSVQGQR